MKASDVRKGTVILHNSVPHRVMDFRHHTPGNLRAMVQAKLRNLISGNQTEVKWASTEELKDADVNTAAATYVYADTTGFHFMMTESFEEVTLSKELLGENSFYLQDQMKVEIMTFNSDPIGVTLPQRVILTVVETTPEIKGATAASGGKLAKTDTGLQITVPPFIKEGERVWVSTEDGAYVERADK